MAHEVTRLFESNLHRPHSPLPSPEWPGQRPPNSALGFLPSEGASLFSYKLQRRLGGGGFVKMVPSVCVVLRSKKSCSVGSSMHSNLKVLLSDLLFFE